MTAKDELAVPDAVPIEVLRPIASPDQLVEAFRVLQELKRKLITAEDLYVDDRGDERLKASGWRKLAIAFGLSIEATAEDRIPNLNDKDEWISRITLRATARGGRSVIGIGYFSSKEVKHTKDTTGAWVHPTKNDRGGQPIVIPLEHLVSSRAYTRALKRAVQDMLGPVEQETEDLEEAPVTTPKAPTPPPQTTRFPMATGPRPVDAGQRAVLVRYLETILGEDLVELVDIEDLDGEILVRLDRKHGEHAINSFIGKLMKWGHGCHETAQGVATRIPKPKAP